MSSSAFVTQHNGVLFEYIYTEVEKEEFFNADDDGVTNITDDDLKHITQLTTSKETTSEEQYRDKFYSTLVKNEKCSDLVTILLQTQNSGKEKYTEASMSNLFVDMYNETISVFNKTEPLSERTFKKQRVEHALLIANTSQPDLVVVQQNGLKTIRIGEFKQHKMCSMIDATNQCFSYMSSVLYFYRAVCHIPLVSVYGFAFCGDQCNDLNQQYAIGLFQLSAPNMIGRTFIAKKYWQSFPNGSNEGIKLLLHYLIQGKSWELPTISPNFNIDVRLPALFMTPNSYWNDIFPSESNTGVLRVLQRNGSSAIVFRVNFAGLLALLNDMMTEGNKFFAALVSSVNLLGKHAVYYVKIRVADTSPNFVTITSNTLKMYTEAIASGGQTQEELYIWKDILDLYVVPPYYDDTFHCIVMADAGRPLTSYVTANCFGESTMIRLLIGLRLYTNEMIEADIFHGDFLPHNFVYSETAERIKVIDFDEGSFSFRGSVPQRLDQNEAKVDSSVFALRYPNLLRYNCELYTKVQFAASVLALLGSFNGDELVKNRNLLQNEATKLGIELARSKEHENSYRAGKLAKGTKNVCSLIDNLNICMDALLNANYDAAEVGCDE